ncbi:MAG: hypothetical protein KDE58_10945, partial [Caldilineaceae bacterium]|nr:hypothetical protein [Caldilineaceae bacterium]
FNQALHGRNGLLVPPDDVSALAAAMQRLIEEPARCAQMGETAQRDAEVFLAKVSVPRFEQLYQRVLKRTTTANMALQSEAL